jgi:hypothetical protein
MRSRISEVTKSGRTAEPSDPDLCSCISYRKKQISAGLGGQACFEQLFPFFAQFRPTESRNSAIPSIAKLCPTSNRISSIEALLAGTINSASRKLGIAGASFQS